MGYVSYTKNVYANAKTGVEAVKFSPPRGKTSMKKVPSTFDAPGGFVYHLEDKKFLPSNYIGFYHVCSTSCTYIIYSPFMPMIRYSQ